MFCNCISNHYNLEKDRIAEKEYDGILLVGEHFKENKFVVRYQGEIVIEKPCTADSSAEKLLDAYLKECVELVRKNLLSNKKEAE